MGAARVGLLLSTHPERFTTMAQAKLTMISVAVHGRRYTKFVQLLPDADGKFRVDENDQFSWPLRTLPRGTTYTPGG